MDAYITYPNAIHYCLIQPMQDRCKLRRGGAFDGWTEGKLNFPPTYIYESNSDSFYGEDPKVGKRTPAWCDCVLSYGKGMQQLSYKRAEIRDTDHRPVSALYMIEVEAFSLKKSYNGPLHLLIQGEKNMDFVQCKVH